MATTLLRPRFVLSLTPSTTTKILAQRLYTTTAPKQAKNRLYNPVRTEEEFETLNLISSSSRQPLITLWTASWCPSCKQISPLLSDIVSSGAGEAEGGVGYAEIQLDSPTIGGLMMRYSIGSMPTLMAFDRQEAQLETRVTNVDEMKSRRFLEDWIRREASRQGMGGGGGSGGSLFSGLFGRSKS